MYATSIIMVLATPVLAITLFLLALEHLFHVGIQPCAGGRPAAVPALVLVLFASGRLHHDLAGHGGRQRNHCLLFEETHFWAIRSSASERGHRRPRFLVWGHHMFVTGQSVYAGLIFSR